MFCTKCGNQMADGSKFCTQCGALLEVPETVNEVTQEVVPSVEEALQAVETPVEATAQPVVSPVEEMIQETKAALEAPVAEAMQETKAAVEETVQAAADVVNPFAATPAPEVIAAAVPEAPVPEAIVAAVPETPAPETSAPVTVFCTNCGAAIPEGFMFCTKCGTKVGGEAPAMDLAPTPALNPAPAAFAPVTPAAAPVVAPIAEPAAAPVSAEETKAERKAREKAEKQAADEAAKQAKAEAKAAKKAAKKGGFFKKFILFLIILILILAAAAAGFWFYLRQPKTFNVENYVTVEFSGYQSNGTAKAVLDKEAMTEEIKEAMSLRLQVAELLGSLANKVGLDVDFDKCMDAITLTTDKTSGLNNGDEVNVSISYDNEALKGFGINYTGEAVKAKAENLSSLQAVDPFEGLTITFGGVNGEGFFDYTFDPKNGPVKITDLVFDKMNGLTNGDVVTVTLKVTSDDVRPAGYELSKTSATYTVAGLDDYVTGPSDKVDAFIEAAKRGTDPIAKAFAEQYAEKYDVEIGNVEQVGYILAVHEEGLKSKLYSIYRAQRVEDDQIAMLYMPIAFKTMIISEGTLIAEPTDEVWTQHNDNFEMCNPIAMIDKMAEGGYTLYFGGSVAEFEGMKDIVKFDELTEDDIEAISYESMALISNARDVAGLTDQYNIDEADYYGGYLFINKAENESVLVMVTEAVISNANGATYTAYFPTMYINPMKETSGEFVVVAESTDVPGMTGTNKKPGFEKFEDLHELIMSAFSADGVTCTMSENIEALDGGEVVTTGGDDVDIAETIANSPGGQMAAAPYTTIEEYFNDEAITEYYAEIVENSIESSDGLFTFIEFNAMKNDVYIYYYIASDKAEDAKKGLTNSDLDDLAATGLAQIQDECGIVPTSLTYAYYSEGGDLLASGTAKSN